MAKNAMEAKIMTFKWGIPKRGSKVIQISGSRAFGES
jgi:hypothetical protein